MTLHIPHEFTDGREGGGVGVLWCGVLSLQARQVGERRVGLSYPAVFIGRGILSQCEHLTQRRSHSGGV